MDELVISTQVINGATSFCHFTTVPVLPDKVSVVEFVPEQTVALPAILPPTDVGSTVIVTTLDSAAPVQLALQLTLARRLNQVVCVNEPGV